VDPAEAQRRVDRLGPGEARPAAAPLVEADQQLGAARVMAREPAVELELGAEVSRTHALTVARRRLHRARDCPNMRAADVQGVSSARCPDEMKPRTVSRGGDPARPLKQLNAYLERNFPEFFAEVRFQAGEDDYFLYARFGQYLARVIEHNRAGERTIRRGFTLLNQMARAA